MRTNKQYGTVYFILSALLVLLFIVSICYGAVEISISEITSAFGNVFSGNKGLTLNERILLQIRLPRACLCIFAGSSLAVGGVLMQALFRNPIVEPGLIGTSSGAAFGAALYFVLGSTLKLNAEWGLPFAAFGGGALSTVIVFLLAERKETGRSSVIALLLTGIAINALFLSCVGFLAYIARDPQARSITFWSMGSLAGASWYSVIVVGSVSIFCLLCALRNSKQLNTLVMGEEEARLMGVDVRKLKLTILFINVLMIAICTAFVGVISFVGLVVPHLLRMWKGSDNRYLIIGGALMGAALVSMADVIARVVLRPAELPIGIVTSLVGVPVFIYLLRTKKYYF